MRYRVLLLLMAFVIPNFLFAQIAVKSFRKLESDLAARVEESKIDQNGDLCAIIKIVTTQVGFTFDCGQIGIMKIVNKPSEIWVYLPYGAKRITISHPQLGLLRDYLFPQPIEKGTVYELVLVTGTVETIVKPLEIESQWLLINTDPPGADVYINDQSFGKTPYQNELPTGKYTWRLQKELYLSEAGTVELIAGDNKQKIDQILKPNFGTIHVNSTPESGSAVSMNGRPTGKITPCTFDTIIAGTYTFSVSRDMYETTSQKVSLTGGEKKDVQIVMNPTFAEISILTEPASEIYVNNKWKASGTWKGRLSPGIYTFEARLDRYASTFEKQTVMIGQPLNLTLRPTTRLGNLKVMSTPFEADITLDGKPVGKSPMTLKNVLIGDHKVELSLNEHDPYSIEISVDEGQTATVNAMLVSNLTFEKPTITAPQVKKTPKPENIYLLLAGISAPIDQKAGFIMVGKVSRIGSYVKFKSNLNFSDAFVSQGESTTERFFNGKVYQGRLAVTGGLLYRIASPIIVYGGLGYGNRWVNWEKLSGERFRVTDYSFKGLEMEAGVVLKIKRLLLSGGISSYSPDFYEADFGLGFTF